MTGERNKEMVKIGRWFKSLPGRAKKAILGIPSGITAAAIAMDATVKDAMADNGLKEIKTKNSDQIVNNVVDTIETLATYAGIFLLVIGLIMLFMGFKNEDSEAKHRAGLVIIAGIGCVGIKAIVSAVTGVGQAGANG